MKKYEKELVKYCEKIINSEDYKKENSNYKISATDWMFGAINFSFGSGLIDAETHQRLFDKYIFKK